MIFSLLLTLFALGAWRKTWQQHRREHVSRYWFAVATVLWTVVIGVAWMPDVTTVVARSVGIGRGADLITYSAVVLLTYAVLRLIARQQELSRELTELTRVLAIKQAHRPPHQQSSENL
jgi:hypothetical protein